MSNTIVPLVWLNETALLDAETHDQLMQLVAGRRVARVFSSLALGIGVLLLLVFSVGIVANKYRNRVRQLFSNVILSLTTRKTMTCWKTSKSLYQNPKRLPMAQSNHDLADCFMHNLIWVFLFTLYMDISMQIKTFLTTNKYQYRPANLSFNFVLPSPVCSSEGIQVAYLSGSISTFL